MNWNIPESVWFYSEQEKDQLLMMILEEKLQLFPGQLRAILGM